MIIRPLASELIDALLGKPMPGARCQGAAPAYDADVAGEDAEQREARLRRALAACGMCRALDACRRAVAELPPRARTGVWAGQVYPASLTPAAGRTERVARTERVRLRVETEQEQAARRRELTRLRSARARARRRSA